MSSSSALRRALARAEWMRLTQVLAAECAIAKALTLQLGLRR
jgi:hypothetical protein